MAALLAWFSPGFVTLPAAFHGPFQAPPPHAKLKVEEAKEWTGVALCGSLGFAFFAALLPVAIEDKWHRGQAVVHVCAKE